MDVTRKDLEVIRSINQDLLVDMVRQLRIVQKFIEQGYPVYSWNAILNGLVANRSLVFCRIYYHDRGEPCLGCPFAFTGPLSWGHASCFHEDGGDQQARSVMHSIRTQLSLISGPYEQPLKLDFKSSLVPVLREYEKCLFALLDRFGLPQVYEHPSFNHGGSDDKQEE